MGLVMGELSEATLLERLNHRLRYISREPEGSPCRAGLKEIDGGPVRVYTLHMFTCFGNGWLIF
jgi:hypothetical protein